MLRTLLLTGLLVATLPACAATRQTMVDPAAASQVEIARTEPPASAKCAYIGPIKGDTMVGDLADAQGDAVRKAVLTGGNYIAVDRMERPVLGNVGGYLVSGRLFNCPRPGFTDSPRAPVQTASASPENTARPSDSVTLPKAICVPECSPGFTCVHALCVTACNPACGSGEQCGADRACHPRK